MASWLKQNVAADIMLGPFVDSTDGFTPETALTITQPDIRLSKNGGAFAQKSAAQTLTHGENGWYAANLSTTDTNTLGLLTVAVYESGALPVWREFQVVTAAVWDAYMSTGVMPANVTQWLGTAVTTPNSAGTPVVDVMRWMGSVGFTNVAGVPLVDTTYWRGQSVPLAHTAGYPIVTVKDGTGTGEIDTAAGVVSANVTAMAANVITAAATATDFSTEVNTAVLAVLGALADAAADGDPTSADTVMAYIKQLVNTLVGTVGIPTYPAPVAPGNGVSVAESLREVYALVGGLNAGLTFIQNDTDNIQTRLPAALVGGRMDSSVGAMANDVITAAATAADFSTENNAAVLAAMPAAAPTATVVADAVWDEAIAGHLTAGSTGAALNGAGSAGDPWTTPLPGAYGAGTAGKLVGDNLNATVSSRANQVTVDAINSVVTDIYLNRLPAALVGGKMDAVIPETQIDQIVNETWDEPVNHHTGVANSAGLTLFEMYDDVNINLPNSIAAVQADTNDIQSTLGTNLDVQVSSRATPAQVNAEVLDVLNVDNFGEPAQGAPAATASLVTKIGFLYKFLRNRVTATATTISVYDDAAATVDHKATHSDNGTTYDRGEFGSGP